MAPFACNLDLDRHCGRDGGELTQRWRVQSARHWLAARDRRRAPFSLRNGAFGFRALLPAIEDIDPPGPAYDVPGYVATQRTLSVNGPRLRFISPAMQAGQRISVRGAITGEGYGHAWDGRMIANDPTTTNAINSWMDARGRSAQTYVSMRRFGTAAAFTARVGNRGALLRFCLAASDRVAARELPGRAGLACERTSWWTRALRRRRTTVRRSLVGGTARITRGRYRSPAHRALSGLAHLAARATLSRDEGVVLNHSPRWSSWLVGANKLHRFSSESSHAFLTAEHGARVICVSPALSTPTG